jgi:hypothetical protein
MHCLLGLQHTPERCIFGVGGDVERHPDQSLQEEEVRMQLKNLMVLYQRFQVDL